jgi:hypothetical protein
MSVPYKNIVKHFSFCFEGKDRHGIIHISLQNGSCFIFTTIKDPELAKRYGLDVDFKTDGEKVVHTSFAYKEQLPIQEAILESAKKIQEFNYLIKFVIKG